jgi:N-acetylglucosamine kinase
MDEALVLGIDGGGTKTLLAAVARTGTVVTWRRGGGTNPLDEPGWQKRLAALTGDLRPLRPRLCAAAAGLGGYGEIPAVSAAQATALAELLPCPHTLHNDVQMAFEGAFQDAPGVLILAGTGSMAWAQAGPDAEPLRVGGWGHALGDEGSAFWIGQRAVALATQALDGRLQPPDFAAALLAHIGLEPRSAALLGWYYGLTHPRSQVATLAPLVDELAACGEPVAVRLLHQAADHLCAHVQAARQRIGRPALPWSHAGGVFASAALRQRMIERLGPPVAPILPPLGGALWRAARLAGWETGPAWSARVAASLIDPVTIQETV